MPIVIRYSSAQSDHIKCHLKCSHLQNDIINCDWNVTVINYQCFRIQAFCRMPPRMREMYDVVAEYSQYSTLAGEEKSLCSMYPRWGGEEAQEIVRRSHCVRSIIDAQYVVGNPGWVLGVWAKLFWGGRGILGVVRKSRRVLFVFYCIFITNVFKLKSLPPQGIYP